MTKTKGILLIAIGDYFYKWLAYHLAVSIKVHNKNIPIHLLHDGNLICLAENELSIFDNNFEANSEHYTENGRLNAFKLKTFIYDYSKFDRTLFLDVDCLCLSDIQSVFDKLEKSDFQIQEVNRWTKETAKYSGLVWTKVKGIQNLPELIGENEIYPEYNSSFIYFTKSDANKAYFTRVKSKYLNKIDSFIKIGVFYPDELAFSLASMELNHFGESEQYRPIFFAWENTEIELEKIQNKFTFLGMAGGYQPTKLITIYNNLVKQFGAVIGNITGFKFNQSKKAFFIK